jgi:hypothetical protein
MIKNRDLAAAIRTKYAIFSADPEEWLREIVFHLTKTTLIKSRKVLAILKSLNQDKVDSLLRAAPLGIGTIYLRHKPLFLALKAAAGTQGKAIINRWRKDADRLHSPVKQAYFRTVVAHLRAGTYEEAKLKAALGRMSTSQKLQLLETLKSHVGADVKYPGDVAYIIRNGSAWVDMEKTQKCLPDMNEIKAAYNTVLSSVVADIRKNFQGKKFYIPQGVNYASPTSEKTFIGNIPLGTYFTTPDNKAVVGVHWYDLDATDEKKAPGYSYRGRVDLDLSGVNPSGKVGFGGGYTNGGIYYSGDVTSAPRPTGASELLYFSDKWVKNPKDTLVYLNAFNLGHAEAELAAIDCSMVVGMYEGESTERSALVKGSDILFSVKFTLSAKSNVLGMVVNIRGETRVYPGNFAMGAASVVKQGKVTDVLRNALVNKLTSKLSLSEVITICDGIVVDSPDNADVDLSIQSLDKDTILKLFRK